jgi:mannose-6-phosphate isomerase-like protein (cupin superfamily)
MSAILDKRALKNPTHAAALAWFRSQGLAPHAWSNAPGDGYAPHAHDYHKVLLCLRGSIAFHTADGDVELEAGDRLDVEPGTLHSATVGREGVTCLEAAVERPAPSR